MLIKAPWNPAGHPGPSMPSLRSSDHAQSASNPFISWIQLNALAAHLNQLPLGSALPSSVLSSQFIESPLTTILLSCACRPLPLCPPSHHEFSLVPLDRLRLQPAHQQLGTVLSPSGFSPLSQCETAPPSSVQLDPLSSCRWPCNPHPTHPPSPTF
jgi:hypothetical protein